MKKLLFTVVLFIATITFGQTGPTNTWVDRPADNAILEIGTAYTVSGDYDAGDDGAGLEYEVGNATDANILQYSIQLYTGVDHTTRQWKDGKDIPSTLNTHSGTSATTSISYTIPTLVPTADLTTGDYYVMRLGYQNSNGGWSSGAAEIPITIVAAPVGADAISWTNPDEVYLANTSIDVSITYTSDMDIAAGAVEVTLWSVSGGEWSHQWRDSGVNAAILPAGVDQTSIITIDGFPVEIANGGILMTNEELFTADPNPAPAGFSSYHYELRFTIKNQAWADLAWISNPPVDVNFVPIIPGTSYIHVDPNPTAGVKNYELKKIGVYPNPTTGLISVEAGDNEIETVSIYDILGKEVLRSNKSIDIDVSGLSKGVYLLKTNNGRLSKFIKE